MLQMVDAARRRVHGEWLAIMHPFLAPRIEASWKAGRRR